MSVLENITLLKSLSSSERANLSLFCQEKTLKKGDILFNEGEDANAMYLLKSGRVRILKNIDGKEVVLGEINAEEILGEMALFCEKGKRMATAEALSNSSLVTILSFSIKELTLKHPELLEKIKTIIEKRKTINKMIEESVNKKQKL